MKKNEVIPEGYIRDYISGEPVKATPEEVNAVQVFSRILVEDYGYPSTHIQTRPQFRVKARPSDLKKEYPVDIAVFNDDAHSEKNAYIIVECKKPNRKDGRKQLEIYLSMSDAEIGVWYNGKEKLCVLKVVTKGKIGFKEIQNIPQYGERIEDIGKHKRKDLIPTHNLKSIFKDIRNYFAANNVGITMDEMLAQQFINLLLCKIYDEKFTRPDDLCTFRAGSNEPKGEVKKRIQDLFEKVKLQYSDVFEKSEKISLSVDCIVYAIAQLQDFCIRESERDAIGDAFESFIDYATKGPQGQFFTPRNVIRLITAIVKPKMTDRLIDPACGTGGFLIEGMKSEWTEVQKYGESLVWPQNEIETEKQRVAIKNIRGIDKDTFLSKVAKAYMALMDDGRGGIFCENSLDEPANWKEKTRADIQLEGFDIVLTNPPFGKKLKITESTILENYNLGKKWERQENGSYRITEKLQDSQPPQILFIERCLNLLNKEGRMCFIAPESMFCNPSHKYIIHYIKSRADILAIISMPEELFQPYTHAKTCIVYLSKKRSIGDHPIFMGIARWCGHDSRGNEISRDDIPQIQERYEAYYNGENIDYDHLGFVINESELINNVYLPKYYNPEIEKQLEALSETHELISIRKLVDEKILKINTGSEVKKENYGSGPIPFIRTSDIANWEIKIDPKQGLSREIYERYKKRQDVKADDILMVRDGTYLVGTCALVNDGEEEFVYQSHIFKIRVIDKKAIHPYLLLAVLSSPIVKQQIYSKRFTQDIIDTLGERIYELVLPIPKDVKQRNLIINKVKSVKELKQKAKNLSREAMLEVASLVTEKRDSKYLTLITQ